MTDPLTNTGACAPPAATRRGAVLTLICGALAVAALLTAGPACARGHDDDLGGGGGHKKGSEYDLDGGRGYDPYADLDKHHGKANPSSFYGETPEGKKAEAVHKPRNPDADVAVTHPAERKAKELKALQKRKGKDDEDDEYNDHGRNPDDDGDDRPPKGRGEYDLPGED